MSAIELVCTVRGCGARLDERGRSVACANGHVFDRARSGYLNLLQPNERRSMRPGDSAEAVAARRRFVAGGYEAPIADATRRAALELLDRADGPVLDVGCGEGSFLGALAAARPGTEAAGVDISTPAVDLAARAFPAVTWIVANADRSLPFADCVFRLATSITARRNATELRRVLSDDGWLLVTVPGPDDLGELREAVQGRRDRLDVGERVARELEGAFSLVSTRVVSARTRLDRHALADLLASTYRGARHAERDRARSIDALDVTLERVVLIFRPVS